MTYSSFLAQAFSKWITSKVGPVSGSASDDAVTLKDRRKGHLNMPTPPECSYSTVTSLLCQDTDQRVPHGFRLIQSAVPSSGSRSTLALVADGRTIQAGICQRDAFNDVYVKFRNRVRVVASLYPEVVMFFGSSALGAASLSEMAQICRNQGRKLTIACLATDCSQSCHNLKEVLKHHDFTDMVNILSCDYRQALEKLRKDLVDGVFVVGSPQHPVVEELATDPRLHLYSMEERDGLQKQLKAFKKIELPPRTFGVNQTHTVETLCTDALLIISAEVPGKVAAGLHTWLMENRYELQSQLSVFDISEVGEDLRMRMHDGIISKKKKSAILRDPVFFAALGVVATITVALIRPACEGAKWLWQFFIHQ